MPDLNLYQRHSRWIAADGMWIGYINEFPELETVGASSTIAIGLLDNALIGLIEQYQEEGWTVPMPGSAVPDNAPTLFVVAIGGILMIAAMVVLAARCGWMPAGW